VLPLTGQRSGRLSTPMLTLKKRGALRKTDAPDPFLRWRMAASEHSELGFEY